MHHCRQYIELYLNIAMISEKILLSLISKCAKQVFLHQAKAALESPAVNEILIVSVRDHTFESKFYTTVSP